MFFGKKRSGEELPSIGGSGPASRYRHLAPLGEGGLAQVNCVFDTLLNRIIAVKELKPESRKNKYLLQAFINEAKLMGYLDHPGVVPVFDTFQSIENGPTYTMKLISGMKLDALMEKRTDSAGTPLPLTAFYDIFEKLCYTLAYVHDKGVIHLDLKPDNIMIGQYGEVMVADWGNARLYDPAPYQEYLRRYMPDTGMAQFEKEDENIILGTPRYMSPEQTSTTRAMLRPASDIFSTGLMLYEMLAGAYPYTAQTAEELAGQIRKFTPPPVHEANPEVPRRLSQICQRMMERKAENRYQTFHDVLRALAEFRNSGQAFPVRLCTAGEIIFNEGEDGTYAFSIISGKVEIFKTIKGLKTSLAVLGNNEVVGELAIITKQPRSATAQAIEPTVIRIMSHELVEKELEKLSPWVGGMITGLCGRLIDTNNKLVSSREPDRPKL
jgi:eukaryotic-like serine/threonine-protein kinase